MAGPIRRAPGQVVGRAGGGLDNATWAKNDAVARIGKSGEVRTAAILDALAAKPGGPTVLHDLRIPIPGFTANIDHVVVSGRTVYLLDAKVWRPGFYWTVRGRTRRGLSRFTPAEKKTMPMAQRAVTGYLANHRVVAEIAHPLLVVWPSSDRSPMHLWAMVSPGAGVVTGARFAAKAHRLVGTRPADPVVVAVLAHLVNGLSRTSRTVPLASGF
jgi:hypothetical protein